MDDVIGYEEKEDRVLKKISAGYPRFFRNPLIQDLANRWAQEHCMLPNDPLLPTEAAAVDLCEFLGLGGLSVAPVGPLWTVRIPDDREVWKASRSFLQHTGSGISSREAEAILHEQYGCPVHEETRREDSAENNLSFIRSKLHGVYETASESDIFIFRGGMNAFYSGFRAIQSIQMERGRDLWIQLGWLYVDTARILEAFSLDTADPIQVFNVLDLADLREVLFNNAHRIAGIVTEVPTNPLVQTPDVQELRELADKYKAALILDPTLVSPHNVNVLEYSDLHINSLTKYAASGGDVMMGALALNAKSPFYDDLLPIVSAFGSSPSPGDLARMAMQIEEYPDTIERINHSTSKVAAFLEAHPQIESVYWAHSQPAAYNYNWLQHRKAGPGGIISFTLKKPLAEFYDPSRIVKSPSFGTHFTMMCPFMYLAHYDLAGNPEGRQKLQELGISPDLIRLSIGLEPAEEIIAELSRTLT